MKIYNKINIRDVLAVDGGYTLFIRQFEDLCIKKNIKLCDNNFFYPIRKEPELELNIQEKHFNDVFGSFRSIIENQFCELHNKFKRFKTFNIITQDHHKLWMSDNFDFPTEHMLVDIVLNNEIKQLEKIKIMTELQKDFNELDIIEEDNMVVDENAENNINIEDVEDVDFPQYKDINKKKRKKGKSARKVNINLIRDLNKNNQFYEIETIIDHKLDKNSEYIFYVKWEGYDTKDNTWVNEKDFSSKDIIKKYFLNKNIKY
ncbi:hypothetical protein BDB01DRAFT_731401 [Pilobolus umbonatus]|nr:hypothetical protein BDB01DRAFT_731401 [Pilobolus umbonatus]